MTFFRVFFLVALVAYFGACYANSNYDYPDEHTGVVWRVLPLEHLLTWQEAQARCSILQPAGWRLPASSQLAEIPPAVKAALLQGGAGEGKYWSNFYLRSQPLGGLPPQPEFSLAAPILRILGSANPMCRVICVKAIRKF